MFTPNDVIMLKGRCETEIRDTSRHVILDQHIRRFKVPMSDCRLSVGIVEERHSG
jgi:hypothetical protein